MRLSTVLPLACVALCLAAPTASAHAILMQSEPRAAATVPAGPTHIVLRFNSRIDQGLSRVELRRPGAAPMTITLAPASAPDILAADVALQPGAAVIRWQVLAVDGHITRGDVPITVKPAPAAAP